VKESIPDGKFQIPKGYQARLAKGFGILNPEFGIFN
jgi:hypothetical protein